MPVLILKNVATEGPGTIGDFLAQRGISHSIVDLTSSAFPAADPFDALVMMGGPMSVNESDIYPYIDAEAELARTFMKQGKKVLGICLGAQIMAKALGARVYPGPEKEIGWYDIELTSEGAHDRLMEKLACAQQGGSAPTALKVFHWHGETFEIPGGAVRLAQSALYPNQAFRYGANAYALQFHIEVDRQMIHDWLKNEPVDMALIERETESCYADYAARAVSFYEEFFA